MTRRWTAPWMARVAFALLILLCVTPLIVQSLRRQPSYSIEIVSAGDTIRTVTLLEMKSMSVLTREGTYQNQYGNWRDQGIYSGVRISDLVGEEVYSSIDVVADDGYRITVELSRLKNPDYPMVLAFSMDGVEVPVWEEGFRVAILPEDGAVSNDEYGVDSAGSYWVMHVSQLILNP